MTTHLDGAVHHDGVDHAVAWHFGDPLREQRSMARGAGVVDRSNRDILVVAGEDRLPWLHSICSQHVAALRDGESTESLVLSPHGHVEQHWQVTELGATVWIDSEPATSSTVVGYLEMMRFLKRVEPADASADWAVISLVGPATPDVLAGAGLPVPQTSQALSHPDDGGFVRRMSWPGEDAADLIVAREAVPSMIERLKACGADAAGMWAYEAMRVQARRPRLRFETDHRTIPHEVGWIGQAVHLNKGCYRGQETVARVQNLGKPPRRLVLLHLSGDSDALPETGTAIELDGRSIGFVGTALHHYELGPIALGVIKRAVADDAGLTVSGSRVSIDAS
ncbi:MAG: folate-binding protein [Actinomycetota bacterium]|nr:folate-binding protein [Actinomycetota bacterium]